MDEQNLKILLSELKLGHEPAFNRLYLLYSKALYQRINQIIKNDEVSEDILQNLFLKIWEKRHEIHVEQQFTSLLYTIAKNMVYDYLRKISRDKNLHAQMLANAVDRYSNTDEFLLNKETSRIIDEAVTRLSGQRRRVFVLCKVEGKTYQQAADELGITMATVNSHMVKSLSSIKQYLHRNNEIGTLFIAGMILSCPSIMIPMP